MKIYRLYYIETEWCPSNIYDEDGYCDDYYDTFIDHNCTVGYFINKEIINDWIEKRLNNFGEIEDENGGRICYDEDLQIEEIEVIE